MTPIDTRPGPDQDVGVRSEHGQLQSSDLVLSVNFSSKEREKGARGGIKHDIKKIKHGKGAFTIFFVISRLDFSSFTVSFNNRHKR